LTASPNSGSGAICTAITGPATIRPPRPEKGAFTSRTGLQQRKQLLERVLQLKT
jgi:hypothetical protein